MQFLLALVTLCALNLATEAKAQDLSKYVGMAAIVQGKTLYLVPTDYVSPNGLTYDQNRPIVLEPGDAFVIAGQVGNQLQLEFYDPDLSAATVPASEFPADSLQFVERSLDEGVADARAAIHFPEALIEGFVTLKTAKSPPKKVYVNCALHPHHPGCCLAAVKYKLIEMKLVDGLFPVVPKEYGLYATKCLPSNFKSVGCDGRKKPVRGTVCSYISTLSPGEGHVEVYDGIGWYFGLGHQTLQNDGHHTCIDCKDPVEVK